MQLEIFQFLTILLLTLGLGLLLTGIFTAYFGRGKSRMVGVALLVIGLIIGLFTWLMHSQNLVDAAGDGYMFMDTLWLAIEVIGAFIIGAVIALVIFLGAIMKT